MSGGPVGYFLPNELIIYKVKYISQEPSPDLLLGRIATLEIPQN